jgi:hypothetical protein
MDGEFSLRARQASGPTLARITKRNQPLLSKIPLPTLTAPSVMFVGGLDRLIQRDSRFNKSFHGAAQRFTGVHRLHVAEKPLIVDWEESQHGGSYKLGRLLKCFGLRGLLQFAQRRKQVVPSDTDRRQAKPVSHMAEYRSNFTQWVCAIGVFKQLVGRFAGLSLDPCQKCWIGRNCIRTYKSAGNIH